jgi:UDP-N-acetylmuramoyl-L-alanyl-D-glutamate--2,6-diaminopimelate ligase
LIFLTLDSPNDEPPEQIIADLERGVLTVKDKGYDIVWDRREAMRLALERALPGDAIVATGRGHESEFRVGQETFHLDDAETFAGLIQEGAFCALRR